MEIFRGTLRAVSFSNEATRACTNKYPERLFESRKKYSLCRPDSKLSKPVEDLLLVDL
jgi:hypothetical protein